MLATLLFDLILAVCLGCGPYCTSPGMPVYASYAPTPCACPKDSPCKEDCKKDACCCKETPSSYLSATAPVCCPYSGCCPVPVPVMVLPNPPMPPGAPCLYEVELKMGKDAFPRLLLPMNCGSMLHHLPASPKCEGVCQVGVHLSDAGSGCVKVDLHLATVRPGTASVPTMVVCKGSKTVHLDTPTNVLLSCDDPEPCSVELFIKQAEMPINPPPPAPPVDWCPRPVAMQPIPGVPCPPLPPVAIAPPGFYAEQFVQVPRPAEPVGQVYIQQVPAFIPEPQPLPMPTPLTRCVAVTPVKESSAHFKLVHCCHKSVVGMKCEDVAMTGTRMTIDKGACGSVTVAAGQKYVHIKGKKWKAQADSVEIRADGHIVLTGHVKLISDKIGVCASVKAEKLCVEVKDGKFIGVGSKE